ncbi:MAG: protein-L-isoaspartate(D-aspartate) O-methyltransferase [Sandaracinaceae bacterium]
MPRFGLFAALLAAACGPRSAPEAEPRSAERPGREPDAYEAARAAMVRSQIEARGVRDPRVLAAMRRVPRHRFVPAHVAARAYGDHPLPIGHDQTISQPYIVASMTELAELSPGERVLEIGTGSGYQAAVLAEIGVRVFTIEIVEPLGRRAFATLAELGYEVEGRIGDGYMGWPEEAPFDAILLTAAPPQIPAPLLTQLAVGGRLVAPVGDLDQELVVIERTDDGLTRRSAYPVRFVPMTGRAQED